MSPNTNCLEGMRCPKCGSYGPFDIVVTKILRISDEGSSDEGTEETWDGDSFAWCAECDHDTTVAGLR